MEIISHHEIATKEKTAAALASVFAAIALTLFKIVIGLLTGSLGILAEAAHSSLDLVAAIVTLFAVRLASRPADSDHPYGHGKIENLSALFETLLLLVTSVWIIYEAVQRLFFKEVVVESSIWAFVVMGVSIFIDINRSRILAKAAKKHNSQALEADALHFQTDIWSSSVVIFGLIGVAVAQFFPSLGFLVKADAIAALGVALIVVYVSIQLGVRTIKGLIDSTTPGMAEQITQIVEKIPGVIDIHEIRVRYAGPYHFVDAHLHVDGKQSVSDVHALTKTIQTAIQDIVPEADVLLHPEPAYSENETEINDQVMSAVEKLPEVSDCHDVQAHFFGSKLYITAHVFVDGNLSLSNVHELTEEIESTILTLFPDANINIHPEPQVI